MTVKTMKSEDARIRFRDVMDEVSAGSTEVVVERYHKPTVVIVNYAQWQAWKEAQKAELVAHAKQILADIHSGKAQTIAHDDLKRLLLEKRTPEAIVYVED